MKKRLISVGRKWSLYGALSAAIAYSALTLTSEPAYAALCTPQLCGGFQGVCTGYCSTRGGVKSFFCPVDPSTPDVWACLCENNQQTGGAC